MENRTKLIILAVATVGVILLLRKKGNAQGESSGESLSVTDRPGSATFSREGEEDAYNALKMLIGTDAAWVVPLAIENYNSGKPEYTINGAKDMAVALGVTIFQVSKHKAGKYTRPGFASSEKFLWSEETLAQVHVIYTNHRAKYL